MQGGETATDSGVREVEHSLTSGAKPAASESGRADSQASKPSPTFTPEELERYARHIVLREIGGTGQRKIKNSSVLVIGAGGLGSPALLYLAAAGVGTIGIMDDDEVSLSNLQRQIVHANARYGDAKTESARRQLGALNANVNVALHAFRLTRENSADVARVYDAVLEGSDNFETRYAANAACVELGIPMIYGAISQWEGQVSVFHPRAGTPCYACVFPEAPAPGLAPTCAEAGVVGPLPGVVGSIMAVETVKLLAGAGRPMAGSMLVFDGLWGETRTIRLSRRENCPVCG